jgi:hypothetical protein
VVPSKTNEGGSAVKRFLQKYASDVTASLSGFDRLILRGTLRQLAYLDGMLCYMAINGVRTVDFRDHVLEMTSRLRAAVEGEVTKLHRPVIYLPSSLTSKEQTAREMAARDSITEGTICLLTCVESCKTFEAHRDRATKTLELRSRHSKCLFLYKYAFDPQLGFMHVRIQTWFPFSVQIYINGREWLARQMDAAGLRYQRCDNCFVALEDPHEAQRLMQQQLRVNWPRLLDRVLCELNPLHPTMFGKFRAAYYWSVYQTEWATDLTFADPRTLASIYPKWVRHAIRSFSSRDVMRFLGRKLTAKGNPPSRFNADVFTYFKERQDGVRIKHRVGLNSIKAYDKWSNLRVETTLSEPGDFRVYRGVEGKTGGQKQWLPMRKGVADLHRWAQVSQAANARYLEALSSFDGSKTLAEILAGLVQPVTLEGRRFRGLRPWDTEDLALLRAINRGEFNLNGLRNRDIRSYLFPEPTNDEREGRRRSAKTGRLLRLLRAHGLLQKVPRTHRYLVTPSAREAIVSILLTAEATPQLLYRLAA